jgi:hypothetical protein
MEKDNMKRYEVLPLRSIYGSSIVPQIVDAESGFIVASMSPHLDHKEATQLAKTFAAAPEMREVLIELLESAEYWSEYDVPLGIVDRMKEAVKKNEIIN